MPETLRYSVSAFNTATDSTNKIHDDTVAKNLGFRGGLVPGVDVYAYLCHLPAEQWGVDWLRRGVMNARFTSPVYDGDTVEVTGVLAAANVIELTLTDSTGGFCASGVATLLGDDPIAPDLAQWPGVEADGNRTKASAEALTTIPMGYLEVGYHADMATEYLDDIRERGRLFREDGYAHPGWLLRYCNWVLTSNFELGPWIHVESSVEFLSPLVDGERLRTLAKVQSVSESKGHKFVDLDIVQVANEARPVARVAHRAIYQPRGV